MPNKIKNLLKLSIKIIAGLYVLYLLISYFAVNPLAKRILPWVAESKLASLASVDKVSFDPLRLKTTIENFNLTEKSGHRLIGFEKLVIDFEVSGLFDWAWKFKEISITAPQAKVAISSNGKLNWANLIAKLNEEKTPPSNTIPRVVINLISVKQANIQYEDANRPTTFKADLTPLTFQLKNFSTLPKDRGDYLVAATLSEQGGSLKWRGDLSVNPIASKGYIAFNNVQLAKLMQVTKNIYLPFKAASGDIQASFSYDLSLPKDQPKISLNNITVTLDNLAGKVMPAGNLSLKQVAATIPQLDFSMQNKPQLNFGDLNLKLTDLTYEDEGFVHPLKVNVADFNLGFALAMPQGSIEISKLQSNIAGLTLKSALYNTPVATLEKVNLRDGEVSLENQKASVQSILFSGLKTQVIKEANKPVNWQSILKTTPNTPRKASAESNQQSEKSNWALSLKKLALDNASLRVEDRSLNTPVILDIEKIALVIQDSSLDLSQPVSVNAAFQVKQGGQFTAQGKLTPLPLKADLNVKLTQLMLKPFGPYISQFAFLKLNGGNTGASGKLLVKEGKNLAVAFNGGFSVNKLSLVEEASNAPFLSWERVSSDNLEVSLAPNRVRMTQLQVIKPISKFIIHEDRSMNITRILRNQPSPPLTTLPAENASPKQLDTATNTDVAKSTLVVDVPAPQAVAKKTPQVISKAEASKAPATEAFPVSIETIRIDNAELDFADLSLVPQFGTLINSLTGVINGVSTNTASVAQVELDGKVDDYGSARIRGSIQPFDATNFTDLALSFKNLEMNRLTPYSGKFAGRRIDSGKLSVDLEYKIKQRQLAGENKFIINKLKLGEKVDSADAANLPLDLAIAILEDSDGIIDLDLPISGSLDDPKFSYGNIVWKAIKNVLTKIVTSPFRALGNLFGADSEKLEAISFEVGSSVIAPPEQEKLKTISQALSKRAGLALGITPSYDVVLDSHALQETMLRNKVALEIGVKLVDGQQAGPIDLNNPKTQKAIDALYDTLTKKSFLKKMAAKLEKPKDGHYEEAVEKLTESIEITESNLQALAKSRGEAIQITLLGDGIATDRVHVETPIKINGEGKAINTKLTLDAKSARNNTKSEL